MSELLRVINKRNETKQYQCLVGKTKDYKRVITGLPICTLKHTN